MATITKFEDLIAWQEARTLVKMVYKLTSDGLFSKDFGMRDQIQRASVSAMTNIAEGFDCESTQSLLVFLDSRVVQLWKFSPCFMPRWMSNTSIRILFKFVTIKRRRPKPLSAG